MLLWSIVMVVYVHLDALIPQLSHEKVRPVFPSHEILATLHKLIALWLALIPH